MTKTLKTSIVLYILLAISFPREALVSSTANIKYLDPYFQFEYTENVRKIVDSDRYDDYWADKARELERALVRMLPRHHQFLSEVQSARLPLLPLPLNFGRTSHKLSLKGKAGTSEFVFQFSRALSPEEAQTLQRLVKVLDYEAALPAPPEDHGAGTKAESPLVHGAIAYRPFQKFTLAAILSAYMTKENRPALVKKLEQELDVAAEKIRVGYESREKAGKVWLDPAQLVSLKEQLGDQFEKAMAEPVSHSIFRPFGPLFDTAGRRTNHASGALIYSMLFVSQKPWDETPRWAANRAEFEAWFRDQLSPK